MAALAIIAIIGTVGCSPAIDAEPAGGDRDQSLAPLAAVQRAVEARRAASPSAVVIEGTAQRPGTTTAQPIRLEGTYDGRTGERVHLVEQSAVATRPLERWLVGNDVITATTMPDIDRPWIRFDADTLDEVVATGRQWSVSSTPAVLDQYVASREPSPITTLRVIAAGGSAIDRGPEAVTGRTLEHFDVTTPAPAAIAALGTAAITNVSIDARPGSPPPCGSTTRASSYGCTPRSTTWRSRRTC